MTAPHVAVVVPVHGRGEPLSHLLRHLEAQTYDDFEVVLVGDGSDDRAADVLEKLTAASYLRIYPHLPGEPVTEARASDLGWHSTDAPVIAFTSEHARPHPDWLRWGVTALEVDDRVGFVEGTVALPATEDPGAPWRSAAESFGPSVRSSSENLFVRRAALAAIDGFDERAAPGVHGTALAWTLRSAGWESRFEECALVETDRRGVGVVATAVRALLGDGLARVAADTPQIRGAFWHRYVAERGTLVMHIAVVGVLVAAVGRRPRALVGLVPWLLWRRPRRGRPNTLRAFAEQALVDAATSVGRVVGSVQSRTPVL